MAADRTYRGLRLIAIALALATAGWMIADMVTSRDDPAARAFNAADRLFEDGDYARAAEGYRAGLTQTPESAYGQRGLARALMQLGDHEAALAHFDQAIAAEPAFAGAYANRGILHDRMGHYEQAIADYQTALSLDAELVEGPGWLTRFLRNQAEAPPSIADRLAYLRQEMAKPEDQRVLSVPDLDAAQRSHKR